MNKSTATGPYSPIRKVGDVYFTSGVTGLHVETMTASTNVKEQTEQAFANLRQVLASENLTLDDVVKTSVFLTDMGDYSVVNEVYVQQFTAPRPARSCIAVAELPRVADMPLRVEIEAIACKKQP